MKKIAYILLAISIIFSACKKEEEVVTPTVINGCTDSTATNYNSAATVDDGSCTYPSTLSLVVSGDTLITGDPNVQLRSYLNVTNISNKTIDVRCRINPISNTGTSNPTPAEFSFCWGGVCYCVGTLVSGQLATLTSGQLVVYPDVPAHAGYFDAFTYPCSGKIEYCFYDDANPTDETCFTVTFIAVTGIEENPTNK